MRCVPRVPSVGSMTRKRILFFITLAVPVIVGAALLYRFPPGECRFWPPCMFHCLTGLYCPGCGNTRALALLLRGDVAGSLAKNALFVPLLLCVFAVSLFPKLAYNRYFAWTVAVAVILFFIVRNLPWHPFVLLAPH